MRDNSLPIERRSQRALHFRRVAASVRKYKIGFFSCLAMLIASEVQFDLSDQVGEKVKFHLNPSSNSSNQSKDCK
jgi:hypothetical protein